MDPMAATSADVHEALCGGGAWDVASVLERRREDVLATLRDFASANEDARTSPNLRCESADEMRGAFALLTDARCAADDDVVLLTCRFLKICARKAVNRAAFGEEGINAALRPLSARCGGGKTTITGADATRSVIKTRVAAESASALLNACYERENVDALVRHGGVAPLVRALDPPANVGAASPELARALQALRASAAGALQSVCFQRAGRVETLARNGVPALLRALRDGASAGPRNDPNLSVRAIGALRNVTGDAEAIRAVRAFDGGVELVVDLLEHGDETVAGSAAGATQNLSRERASRARARERGAVEKLTRLLGGSSDPETQAAAAGALMNILGPELDGGRKEGEKKSGGNGGGGERGGEARKALGKIVSSALALSVVWEALYDAPPDARALMA